MLGTAIDNTEKALITSAHKAISDCQWTIGETASQWMQRHSRGRGDSELAGLLNLNASQVYQRRRVWETFSDVRERYHFLRWSHFYAAIDWDDAAECLDWAEETQATVAEMKAWRRAVRGEDLVSMPEE